jgi:hypothetical protein
MDKTKLNYFDNILSGKMYSYILSHHFTESNDNKNIRKEQHTEGQTQQ